jgi:succinate dehydrogenase / fumarate reductase cytochrome b subunit
MPGRPPCVIQLDRPVNGGSHDDAQQRAQRLLGLPPLKLVYAAFLFAFCYHLCAGIRHLVWDTGHGLERAQSQRSAWLVVSASLLLTLVLGYGLLHAGRTP